MCLPVAFGVAGLEPRAVLQQRARNLRVAGVFVTLSGPFRHGRELGRRRLPVLRGHALRGRFSRSSGRSAIRRCRSSHLERIPPSCRAWSPTPFLPPLGGVLRAGWRNRGGIPLGFMPRRNRWASRFLSHAQVRVSAWLNVLRFALRSPFPAKAARGGIFSGVFGKVRFLDPGCARRSRRRFRREPEGMSRDQERSGLPSRTQVSATDKSPRRPVSKGSRGRSANGRAAAFSPANFRRRSRTGPGSASR